MRVLALIISGLGLASAAQKTDAGAQESSLIAAAHAAETAALNSAINAISAQRAAQTLKGEAADQAAHNSDVLASAQAAASRQYSIIAQAESSVLSEASRAIAVSPAN